MRLAILLLIVWAGLALPAVAEMRVRLMTYNIHHAEGLDGKVDVDRIAAVIKAARPDIVCLQEVDRNLPRTGRVDIASRLAAQLSMRGVFGLNHRFQGGDYGNATLTRFEIVDRENIGLPGSSGAEPRGCLRTTLRVGQQLIDVLNTHLGLQEAERKGQAAAILQHARDLPTLLAGDMNEDAKGPALAALLGRFEDTDMKNAGAERHTYPTNAPNVKIDFVLASDLANVLSSRVLVEPATAVASDHLPVVVDLEVATSPDSTDAAGVYDNEDERVIEALAEGT